MLFRPAASAQEIVAVGAQPVQQLIFKTIVPCRMLRRCAVQGKLLIPGVRLALGRVVFHRPLCFVRQMCRNGGVVLVRNGDVDLMRSFAAADDDGVPLAAYRHLCKVRQRRGGRRFRLFRLRSGLLRRRHGHVHGVGYAADRLQTRPQRVVEECSKSCQHFRTVLIRCPKRKRTDIYTFCTRLRT